MPDEVDRYKLQPALAHAAEAACSYYLTDGFCSPRDRQQCKCWSAASEVMKATGLSARAVGFIFQYRSRIEEAAEAAEIKPTKARHGGPSQRGWPQNPSWRLPSDPKAPLTLPSPTHPSRSSRTWLMIRS